MREWVGVSVRKRTEPGSDCRQCQSVNWEVADCSLNERRDPTMQDLLPRAERLASRLKARPETVAVAESSAGGLLAAVLLSVPGASAYFLGGAVVYTQQARRSLLSIPDTEMTGIRSAS